MAGTRLILRIRRCWSGSSSLTTRTGIVSRTWPGSTGSAAKNRCLARASPVPSATSGATAHPPPSAAEFRCVPLTLHSHPKTSNSFPEFSGMFNGGVPPLC